MSDLTDLAVLLVTATLSDDDADTRGAKLAAIEEYVGDGPTGAPPVAPTLTDAEAAAGAKLVAYAGGVVQYLADVVTMNREQAQRLGLLIGELVDLAADAVRDLGEDRARPAEQWLTEWRAARG